MVDRLRAVVGARHVLDDPDTRAPFETDWTRRADDKILDEELGRAIQEATDALPEGYREVFLLKDVEGLSYEEISEMVGISVPAVKSRLHRARRALREAIDAFYKEV